MKNKKIQTIIALVLLIIIVLIYIFYSRTNEQDVSFPKLIDDQVGNIKVFTPAKTEISEILQTVPSPIAQKEKDKIEPILPLSIKNFSTSVGITTNINVFSIASEPSQIIHIEIYGINYHLSDSTTDNPQAVAFIESFNKIKKLLTEKGIKPENLQIIFGTREYIQNTSEDWVKSFNLLP